jgi:hypothetical protein
MPLRVFFEMDFYNLERGPFNQTPRLRHFYGVLGRLLIGRTWGTQSDLFAVPNTIDFAAGDALTGTRRAQIRFEDKLGKSFKYALALEMLEFPGIDAPDSLGQASQNLPLLAGRLTKSTSSGGRLMLGASLFQLRWDGLGIIPNSTAFGWGFSFSGREYFGKSTISDGWPLMDKVGVVKLLLLLEQMPMRFLIQMEIWKQCQHGILEQELQSIYRRHWYRI